MQTKILFYINAVAFMLYIGTAVFLFQYSEAIKYYEVNVIEFAFGIITIVLMSVPTGGLVALIPFNTKPYKDRFLFTFLISTATLFSVLSIILIYFLYIKKA